MIKGAFGPMPMDYFVWLARGGGRIFVIDTGFNAEVAKQRRRNYLRCPVETLAAFDIDAAHVKDVFLTHLHYDHAGNFDRFAHARFHLQERELACATGRYMLYPRLSHSFEVEDAGKRSCARYIGAVAARRRDLDQMARCCREYQAALGRRVPDPLPGARAPPFVPVLPMMPVPPSIPHRLAAGCECR
jgi:hypothetical protein